MTYPALKLLIDGDWKSAPGAPVVNPATEDVLGELPHATQDDLAAAVASAEAGFQVWRRTPPADRARIINKAAGLIRERREAMATAMTMDQGKPIAQALAEVDRGADMLEWDAAEGRRLYGRVIPGGPNVRHTVLRQPIGVVAAFSPWNFPMSSPGRKIGGALGAGCSLILKPAEETPAGAMMMVQAFMDAGLPPGVLNLVYGKPADISGYLIPQPAVRKIAFTGSTAVGKHLAEMAGRYMKPVLMELGGHAPVIVCEDADPEATARLSLFWKLRNAGQVCVSPTRFFVHQSIFKPFSEAFAQAAGEIRVGDGLDRANHVGPLANARRVAAMEELTADALAKGARLLHGGARIGARGYFFAPTVLTDTEGARAMSEEPFGPMALINPVASLDEAIARANALPYGLAGYAFTNSARYINQLIEDLEVGNLSINHFVASSEETPFGGVKESGYGREGGVEGLESYTVVKNVSQAFP